MTFKFKVYMSVHKNLEVANTRKLKLVPILRIIIGLHMSGQQRLFARSHERLKNESKGRE